MGLYLQAAAPRDIIARMLRNLKEIHQSQQDWARLIAVLDRLLLVNPRSWPDYRDRGLALAAQGQPRRALSDLETYLAHAFDALDRQAILERVAEIQQLG
jgi:regulator of sirC expression with transglutaminase-like and TPR domain